MSEGHWIVTKASEYGGSVHNVSFNMDTVVTMWAAMAFVLVIGLILMTN